MLLQYRLSALLQLHLHSRLNIWFQWIGQSQLQDKTINKFWDLLPFMLKVYRYIQSRELFCHCRDQVVVRIIEIEIEKIIYIVFFMLHRHMIYWYALEAKSCHNAVYMNVSGYPES